MAKTKSGVRNSKAFALRCLIVFALLCAVAQAAQVRELSADVCVLGGGSAGIAAAISAARRGVEVVLMEKQDRLGGTSVGAVWLLYDMARQLGVADALGNTRQDKLALWQALAA